MSWLSFTEDYSIEKNDFYGEPKISYDYSDETSSSSSSSSSSTSSGGWEDYQHEREYISACCNQHTR